MMKTTTVEETPSATASKSAHTPGPWEIVRSDGDAAEAARPQLIIQSANPQTYKDDRHIAFCFDEGLTNDQQALADARLIAAAPELLKACKAALENWKPCVDDPDYEQQSAAQDLLVAAIAKAEAK